MFARLFNNIGPRSLVNAIIIAALLVFTYWFKPLASVDMSFSLWGEATISGRVFFIILTVSVFLLAFLFNEWQNGSHFFEPNYYYFLGIITASLVVFYLWQGGNALISWPLLMLLIWRSFPVINPQTDFARLNFGLGLGIGILGMFFPNAVFLLALPLLLGLFYSGLSLRSFMALLLGLGAVLYFTLSIDYFFDSSLVDLFFGQWADGVLYWIDLKEEMLWTCVPLSLHAAILVLISYGSSARYNQEQKRLIGFWLIVFLVAVLGFLGLAEKLMWLSLAIFPYAFFFSRAIQSVQNRWAKDGLILTPIIIYLIGVFL